MPRAPTTPPTGAGEGNLLVSDKEPGPELDLALLSHRIWRELGEIPGWARLRRFAAALHAAYPAPDLEPGEDTLACRCEEIPVRAIRDAVRELGATDARTVKLLTRAGMGWCQGRIRGYGVAALTARACERPVAQTDLRGSAERPLAAPTPLRDLARPPV